MENLQSPIIDHSPYEATKAELLRRYGDAGEFANELMNAKFKMIEDGTTVNWLDTRKLRDPYSPMTRGQENVLLANGIHHVAQWTKLEASNAIDWLMFDAQVARGMAAKRNHNLPPEEPANPPSKLLQWQSEFIDLWTRILEDDVITLDELSELKQWLTTHRVHPSDYADFLTCIARCSEDGEIIHEEVQELYGYATSTIAEMSAGTP